LGKTKAINERYLYAYLPSVEMVRDWKGKAKKSNVSISQFILEHVTNSLRQEEGEESYKPRAEMIEELRKRDETIEKLTRDNEITKLALERVDLIRLTIMCQSYCSANFLASFPRV